MNYKSKIAFTLAEVLITLTIIGVVAALTIPTLVRNYQQRAWNTAAIVFERKLEEALKVMNSQGTLAGYKTTEEFVNELQKHLKITKVCKNDDLTSCFEDKVFWEIINISHPQQKSEEISVASIKNAKDLGQKDWNTEVLGIQLNNGTNALIAYNPQCRQDQFNNQITGSSCIAVVYDTSGFAMPNTSGKDLRAVNAKLVNCAFKSDSACFAKPYKVEPHFWQGCSADGQTTNAEDRKTLSDYGISNCCGSTDCKTKGDYWAGAAIACQGKNKLPTIAQLDELAKYLYPEISSINSSGFSNCPDDAYCRDDNKASQLQFDVITNKPFYIWESVETNQYNGNFRGFDASGTHQLSTGRFVYTPYALCIID